MLLILHKKQLKTRVNQMFFVLHIKKLLATWF